MTPARRPPKKQKAVKTGPRRIAGALLDVTSCAALIGESEYAVRAQVARGVLPHRRRNGRVVFLREEIQEFLRRLPGITLDEALANIAHRREDG